MYKKASYKKVYELYKRAYSWDEFKADAGKAWKGFNDYADKNQWVRPTLYGLGGAGLGFGVGSISKNPLWRVLLAILGGAGGAWGGFAHNANSTGVKVNRASAGARQMQKENENQDSKLTDNQLAAKYMSGQDYANWLAQQQKAGTETAPKTTTAKPAVKTQGANKAVNVPEKK